MASICSVWSSAWLCLGGWWCWSLGSSWMLLAAFLGKCDDQGLGPQGWPFSCLRNLVAVCRKSSNYILSTCVDQFCRDVVGSIWLPFPQWLYCSHNFSAKEGVVVLCVCLGAIQYWWISIGLNCSFTAQSSILSIGSVSVALLWGIFLNDLGQ